MRMLISRRVVTVIGAAGLALMAVGCGSSSSSGSSGTQTSAPAVSTSAPAVSTSAPAVASTVDLKTEHTKLGTVLADAKGLTVYWFAKDTSTSSACTGACAIAWPPVLGMPQASSGFSLTGKFGTIKRADGTLQATYNGHPLYTFEGDTAPGQTNGNGVTAFGARWSVIEISPAAAVTPVPSSSTSGNGYSGY